MSSEDNKKIYGLLAEFKNPGELMEAAKAVNKAGYHKFDAHSPFPIHGMDEAMGLKKSKLGWIVLGHGLLGMLGGIALQVWVHTSAYPMNISGKPEANLPAFVPVTFELTILLAAFGTFFGMFALNKLPKFNHPLFNSQTFEKVTDDGFFISIEAEDDLFSVEKTEKLLKDIGASHVERVYDSE